MTFKVKIHHRTCTLILLQTALHVHRVESSAYKCIAMLQTLTWTFLKIMDKISETLASQDKLDGSV